MQGTNKYLSGFCLLYGILSSQLFDLYTYIHKHPNVIGDLYMISILGTIGQCFIFYTVSCFGARVLGIVTTSRKFFTVLFSIFMFSHPVEPLQWVAMALVFVALLLEIAEGSKKKPNLH